MLRRKNYEGRMDIMLDAIDDGTVPSELNSALASLRKKVQAERDRYAALFQLDNDVHRQPSMGVIELAEEYRDTPQSYFGADVPVRSAVRLTVFQAYINRHTNEIVKGELLAEVVMSAKQFGDLVAAPNRGSGHPVTLVSIPTEGEIAPYNPVNDPTKETLQRLNDPRHRADGSASERLANIRALLGDAQDKGRMSKKEATTLQQAVQTLSGQLAGNTTFRVNRLSEEFQSRANEVSLNVHLDLKSMANNHAKRELGHEENGDV